MMDEDFVERRPADLEIYRRLDAFAQVRLAPDAAAMARIRTALMGQALALADGRAAAITSPALPVALPSRQAVAFPRPHRRAAAAVLAACLVVGVGAGSVAASQAGGPLYGARMWIEAATLPSDPMARANAQFARLDARLQEVRVAASNGNAGAAEAALEAYAVIVTDLESQAATNSAVADSLEDGMARRQVVLIGLLDEVPAQAQDAIRHALQQGANALDGAGADRPAGDRARPANGGPGGGQGGQGQGPGTGQSQGPGTGQGGAAGQGADEENQPDSETTPDPTPDPTPKPTKPPKAPAVAPTPDRRPDAPATPGGGNPNENGGLSRKGESGGSQGGPSNDQGDD